MAFEIRDLVKGILYEGFDRIERGTDLTDLICSKELDELELLVEEGSFRFENVWQEHWDWKNEFIGRGFRFYNWLSGDGIDDIFVYYKGKLVYRDSGYELERTKVDLYEHGGWEDELRKIGYKILGQEQLDLHLA